MSEMINEFAIPGISGQITIEPDYHWRELGVVLGNGFDAEQAELMDSFANTLLGLKGSDGLMQLQYVADAITGNPEEFNVEGVRWLCRELLIRIDPDSCDSLS